MSRDPRYDVLFEPVQIGPVTAKNRFYQVPHCNGAGYRDPSAAAEMRRVKAEGGWGVVFTEQCEIHHTSEITPFIELHLWEDQDIPQIARMADRIKEHGALAGIELAYSGVNGPNLYSREVPLAVTGMPIRTFTNDPVQARSLTKREIKDLRRWFVTACKRSRTAGFELICLYGAHGFGILQHFLSTLTNHRSDEYGGSLENRARFVAEVISDCKDAVGDSVAITLRLSLDEMQNGLGFCNNEVRDFIAMHADLPDLWDLAHGSWEDCSVPSRFGEEAAQQDLVSGIRDLTDRPVVGVGRFTSPDVMARQIKSGVLDLIGCARPSIADPFLPNKIDQGRVEDIRECIGCNMCISGDMTMSLSRCTQNPTFMEEWRKGWHPEIIPARGDSQRILVIGAGPAGLEATRALAERGYDVALAEASQQTGGRVLRESRLPGLQAWKRVADYRDYQLGQKNNVEIFLDNQLNADDILQLDYEHIAIATGASWRRDGVGRQHVIPVPIDNPAMVYTPDDLMDGNVPTGEVVIFDDDHYYMGGVLAELLIEHGASVTLITPAPLVSEWSLNTLDQDRIQTRLLEKAVTIHTNTGLVSIQSNSLTSACRFTGKQQQHNADAVVILGARTPNDTVYSELLANEQQWADAGIKSVKRLGDAEAPGPIAWATYAGHRYARELDCDVDVDHFPFRREITALHNV